MEKYYKDKELISKIKEAKQAVDSCEKAFIESQENELNLTGKLSCKDVDNSIIGKYFVNNVNPNHCIHVRYGMHKNIHTTVYHFDMRDNLIDVFPQKIPIEDFLFDGYRECNEKELRKVLTV